MNLSLTACSFNLKKANSRGTNFIHNLNEKIDILEDEEIVQKITTIDTFKIFFEAFSESINDDNKMRTFNIFFDERFQGETEEYYFLYAILKSGVYGSSSDITDVETKEIKYRKNPNEAEVRPFYLFVVIPKDTPTIKVQKGMLFFQNVGQFGVKTITTDYMKDFFSKAFNITLTCRSIAPSLFIEKVLKRENINKIIMIKNHKSTDSSDNLGRGYGLETRMLANLNLDGNFWDGIMSKISHFVNGRHNVFEFESKEYPILKVDVTIGGKKRTINLHNIDNLSIIENIPNEIKGVDGHPKMNELIKHLKNVADEYLKEMVLSIT